MPVEKSLRRCLCPHNSYNVTCGNERANTICAFFGIVSFGLGEE